MPEEQLSVLLAKLKNDPVLREKFQSAKDLDAAMALVREAGFDVRKADWLKYQAQQTLQLSDQELESVSGGFTGQGMTGGCQCDVTVGANCGTDDHWC